MEVLGVNSKAFPDGVADVRWRDKVELWGSELLLDETLLQEQGISCSAVTSEAYRAFEAHYAVTSNQRRLRDESATLRALRDTRRLITRVSTYHVGRCLRPVILELLYPESDIIDRLERDGKLVNGEWPGARYRILTGDEAVIAGRYEQVFLGATSGLFDGYSERHRAELIGLNYLWTTRVMEAAPGVGDKEFPVAGSDKEELRRTLRDRPYIWLNHDVLGATFRERTTNFLAASSTTTDRRVGDKLQPNVWEQLADNAIGLGEFFAPTLGGAIPYAMSRRGLGPEHLLKVGLRGLSHLAATAALRDEQGQEFIVGKRRDVWDVDMTDGHGKLVVIQEPLLTFARAIESGHARKLGMPEAQEAGERGSKKAAMVNRGRCPSNDLVGIVRKKQAWDEHDEFIGLVNQFAGEVPASFELSPTPAQITALSALALTVALWRNGRISLKPPDRLLPILTREPPISLQS